MAKIAPQLPIEVDSETGVWTSDALPMLYVPRHFFVNNHMGIEEVLGADAYAEILYKAGYKSAWHWCEKEAECHGIEGVAVFEHFTQRTGILTLGTGLVHGFVKSQAQMPTPDVQYFVVHASYANAAERILDKHPGMTIGVSQLRPKSKGSIHIQSADPQVMPAIRPNFLSVEEDRQSLIEGMKIARRIMQRPAMQAFVELETGPGIDVQTDEQWLEFAQRNGQTIYHPIATCRMGEDADAVVDSSLRVRGLTAV